MDKRKLCHKHVLARAVAVLASEKHATEWMRAERSVLGGKKPSDLVGTIKGTKRVLRVLGAIEHGVLL